MDLTLLSLSITVFEFEFSFYFLSPLGVKSKLFTHFCYFLFVIYSCFFEAKIRDLVWPSGKALGW